MNSQERQPQASKSLNGLIGVLPPEDASFERTTAIWGDIHSLQLVPNQRPALFGRNHRCWFGFLRHAFSPSSAVDKFLVHSCVLLVQYSAISAYPSEQLCF